MSFVLILAAASRLASAAPPVLQDVPSREVEVTAAIGDVDAPDRGLVALSDGAGAATILVREAGHLRSQRSSDGGATLLPEVEVSTAASRPVFDHKALLTPEGWVVAAWTAPDPAGDRALYLSRSSDHGATWADPVAVVHSGLAGQGVDRFAVAVGAGGRTAVLWADGLTQSVHARSSADGTTWGPHLPVFTSLEDAGTQIQSLDVGLGPGGAIYTVLVEQRVDGGERLFTARSQDGTVFEPAIERTELFPGGTDALSADLEMDDDGTVLIAAQVNGVTAGRIGLLRSTDGGATFLGSTAVSNTGSSVGVVPVLSSWPGTSLVAIRCVERTGRLILALSADGGVTFSQRLFGVRVQPGAVGSALVRTSTGRLVLSLVDRGTFTGFPPHLESMISVAHSLDGVTWTGARVDALDAELVRVPVSIGLVLGAKGGVTAVWEDPRPDPGTTSLWAATAPGDGLPFGEPGRVDRDAVASRPNASPDPTVASDGGRHVMAVFSAATRSEQNDLYVAASSDGGRTFSAPTLLANEPAGHNHNLSPAAALGRDGVGWVLAETTGPESGAVLRLYRTADFGATFTEPPITLSAWTLEGLMQVTAAADGKFFAAWADREGTPILAWGGGPGTPVNSAVLSFYFSSGAAVCADGPNVTAVFIEEASLVGMQSTDNGETWGYFDWLHAHPQYVELACAGAEATAVWLGPSDDAAKPLHPGTGGIRSATFGPKGWGPPVTLGPASFALPKVVRRGGDVLAAWDENGRVWMARSRDGGANWFSAERLDEQDPSEVRDPVSIGVDVTADAGGRFWAFWQEGLGSEASVVVRRTENGGELWTKMRRLSRERPQHAYPRRTIPLNARAAAVPGAALLAYAGPLTSDWRSVFVNADDALDADRDGYPDVKDCAPENPDTHLCGGPPVAEAGPDGSVECSGDLGALVHLDGSDSTDPDGDLATYRWSDGGVTLAETAVADVTLGLGPHMLVLEVTDSGGLVDTDEVLLQVADTQSPTGGITFPEAGACFGPAQLPVVLADDAADVCDPAPVRDYSPASSFDAHGDHTATLQVQDAAGLVLQSSVSFVIDRMAPTAAFQSGTGTRIDPGHLPLPIRTGGEDADGATGGILRERVLLNGCVALDGAIDGDGDGLLSDETLGLGLGDVCALAARCSFTLLQNAELKLEVSDCGGNVGTATRYLTGSFASQGVCRSPRTSRRVSVNSGSVSLERR